MKNPSKWYVIHIKKKKKKNCLKFRIKYYIFVLHCNIFELFNPPIDFNNAIHLLLKQKMQFNISFLSYFLNQLYNNIIEVRLFWRAIINKSFDLLSRIVPFTF